MIDNFALGISHGLLLLTAFLLLRRDDLDDETRKSPKDAAKKRFGWRA